MGRPSKLSEDQWKECRAAYETGATARALGKRYGISHTTIVERAKAEGWTVDAEEAIRNRTREKATGVSDHADPVKKEQAIEAEADRRVEVLDRHKREWANVQALQNQAILLHQAAVEPVLKGGKVTAGASLDKARAVEAFDLARFAKISAETTAIRHAGERKAIGMDNPDDDTRNVKVIVERKGRAANAA